MNILAAEQTPNSKHVVSGEQQILCANLFTTWKTMTTNIVLDSQWRPALSDELTVRFIEKHIERGLPDLEYCHNTVKCETQTGLYYED